MVRWSCSPISTSVSWRDPCGRVEASCPQRQQGGAAKIAWPSVVLGSDRHLRQLLQSLGAVKFVSTRWLTCGPAVDRSVICVIGAAGVAFRVHHRHPWCVCAAAVPFLLAARSTRWHDHRVVPGVLDRRRVTVLDERRADRGQMPQRRIATARLEPVLRMGVSMIVVAPLLAWAISSAWLGNPEWPVPLWDSHSRRPP